MRRIIVCILLFITFISGFSQVGKIQTVGVYDRNAIGVYGSIYNKNSWASLADFTNVSVTASASGSKINVSNGTNSYANGLDITGGTCLEMWNACYKIKINAAPGATSFLAVGSRSINTTNTVSLFAKLDLTNTGTAGTLYIAGGVPGAPAIIATAGPTLSFSNGDYVVLTLSRNKNVVTATARNYTTNSATISVSFTFSSSYPQTNFLPNTGRFSVLPFTGTYIVDSISIYSVEPKNADLLVIGDSKSTGYYTTTFVNRFASQLQNSFKNIVVQAGVADKTVEGLARVQEVINLNPKQVLLALAANDVLDSVTFKTDYAAIVTALQAAGITVYHLAPLYESAFDQTAERNFILANYPAANIIDTWWDMQVNGTLNPDGVHANDFGYSVVVNKILSSGLIKFGSSYQPLNAIPTVTLDQVLTAGNTSAQVANLTTFKTTSTGAVVPLSNGLMGIRTASPTAPLDIPGNHTDSLTASFGSIGFQSYAADNGIFSVNSKFDGTNYRYRQNGGAGFFSFNAGNFALNVIGSGTAGATFTPLTALVLWADGNAVFGGAITDNNAWLQTAAGTTTDASFYIPEGVAPTSPANGQMWSQTSDHKLYWRTAGVSVCLSCAGTGSPGGSTTQVQYNNAGAFGGASTMTWDNANNLFSITGNSLSKPIFNAGGFYAQSLTDDNVMIASNTTFNGTNFIHQKSGLAAFMQLGSGTILFKVGATGAAASTYTPTLAEYILNNGNVIFGGASTDNNAQVQFSAGTASTAQTYYALSTAPTSPTNGMSWYDGTHFYFRSAGANVDLLAGGGFSNPMTTTGDIIYSSSGTTPARLGIGATNTVMTVTGGIPAWGPIVTSATYTPTLTNTTNISSSSLVKAHYIQIGNIVHVMIAGSVTATLSSTATTLTVTLPVTTTNTTQGQCGVVNVSPNNSTYVPGIVQIVNGTTARADFIPTLTTAGNIVLEFQYSLN